MSSFIPRNLTEIEAVAGCTFACLCNTVFRMFSCLQINCQLFYLHLPLKFHPFDWLIEIYLQTKGQGTHHKMVSLQPMPGFSSLLPPTSSKTERDSLRPDQRRRCLRFFSPIFINPLISQNLDFKSLRFSNIRVFDIHL